MLQMDINIVHHDLASAYTKRDPSNNLRGRLKDEESQLNVFYSQVKNIWDESTDDDSFMQTASEELNVAWLRGILNQKVDTSIADEDLIPDKETLKDYTAEYVKMVTEMQMEVLERKEKFADTEQLFANCAYKPTEKEAGECLTMMKDLIEKINKMKIDPSLQLKNEYNVDLDKNLCSYADNVKRIEGFITALRKISDAQRLEDNNPDSVLCNGELSCSIEHLAERAQIITYMLKYDEENI